MDSIAVIQIQGKQYLVKEGAEFFVENLNREPKENVEFPILLKCESEKETLFGQPELDTKCKVEVIENIKGKKVRVAKFKSKVRYRKVRGFRPHLTKIKIIKI